LERTTPYIAIEWGRCARSSGRRVVGGCGKSGARGGRGVAFASALEPAFDIAVMGERGVDTLLRVKSELRSRRAA
jgi:hypothetical protein